MDLVDWLTTWAQLSLWNTKIVPGQALLTKSIALDKINISKAFQSLDEHNEE